MGMESDSSERFEVTGDGNTLRLVDPYEDREIRFYSDAQSEPIFTITADGVVVFSEGFTATDAARAFVDAVRNLLPTADLKVAL